MIGAICFILGSACSGRAQSTASLPLAWDDPHNSDLAGFKLYYKVKGTARLHTIAIPPMTRQWRVPGLRWGSTYLFTICAVDSQGVESGPSNRALYSLPRTNRLPTISPVHKQVIRQGSFIYVPFQVSDFETRAADLQVSARSSDPDLLPVENIHLRGTYHNRKAVIVPDPNKSGRCRVWLDVTDTYGGVTSTSFVVTVLPRSVCTLDPVGDVVLEEDGAQLIPLSGIGSGDRNGSGTLSIFAESSDHTVLLRPSVIYSSPDGSGYLLIEPAPNASGESRVTVFVKSDATMSVAFARSFLVTVTPKNDPPIISNIAFQTVPVNGWLEVVFNVSDPESPAEALTVTAVSFSPGVIPNEALSVEGTGAQRLLRLRPATDQVGTVIIAITATDSSGASSTQTFDVEVSSDEF